MKQGEIHWLNLTTSKAKSQGCFQNHNIFSLISPVSRFLDWSLCTICLCNRYHFHSKFRWFSTKNEIVYTNLKSFTFLSRIKFNLFSVIFLKLIFFYQGVKQKNCRYTDNKKIFIFLYNSCIDYQAILIYN